MKYVAAFDIGTTDVKGVLVDAQMQAVCSCSQTIETHYSNGKKEQNPLDWYSAFCNISKKILAEAGTPQEVLGIIMSGQMQDLICIDREGMPVGNAILYVDSRAGSEAEIIERKIGRSVVEESTGNRFDGSMPFAKMLWLKNNCPEMYDSSHKMVISSKDYCLARLTDKYVTDVTSASTAGLMDIRTKKWNNHWMDTMGLDSDKLPMIKYAHEKVGEVTEKASVESGYAAGTPVYTGTGDAGATTLASGISKIGEFNIYLGTSGWIACISNDVLMREGVFNLAAVTPGRYINVVPFLNAGGVHKWIATILTPQNMQEKKYAYLDDLLAESKAGSGGVLFLPYLAGERFPVLDTAVKGCYLGITAETTRNDMARACLEGVAFSIKQGIAAIGGQPSRITLVGGGAKAKLWCQILADVLNREIYVAKEAAFLPSIAIAAFIIATNEGQTSEDIISSLFNRNCVKFEPDAFGVKILKEQYYKYLRIYPQVRPLYENETTRTPF